MYHFRVPRNIVNIFTLLLVTSLFQIQFLALPNNPPRQSTYQMENLEKLFEIANNESN